MTIIKRALPVAVAVLALAPAVASAGCNLACLNGRVSNLGAEVRSLARVDLALSKTLFAVTNCLAEAGTTRYGGGTNADGTPFGYVFDPGSGGAAYDVAAIDATNRGDSVQVWLLYDRCNTSTASGASVRRQSRMSRFATVPFPITRPFVVR